MAGDSTRILELLGVPHSSMKEISQGKVKRDMHTAAMCSNCGSAIPAIHFHQETFSSPPFYSINQEADWLEQVLPPAIVLLQNGLGKTPSSVSNF
jgi:hypothetical protein